MFTLNGGGTRTAAGTACGPQTVYPYNVYSYDFGYDSIRGDGTVTFHDRSNFELISAQECLEGQQAAAGN